MTDNDLPQKPLRRLLIGASLSAGMLAQASAGAPVSEKRTVFNVRDFGAKGDGTTDDTEAFNRATRADAEWSWDMLSSILVPAGRYRIAGTVFLRKGQSLIGDGLSTYIDASGVKRSTFVMGRRRNPERGIEDPGGLPVRIERLMGLGGAPDQGFIYATIPGFQISALFLTAVGLGIEIEAADGIVSDVEIDQCLTAILIRNSQNIVLSNLNFYLANYGITFNTNCRDIAITNSTFCYTQYATILLGDGAVDITSVSVSGCIFTNNVPYKTFEGYIYSRASRSDLLVTGCIFRNAPGYAVNQGAGIDLAMTIQGCVFDGQRTNPDYNQSLDPRAIRTGHGRFHVAGCIFRRHPTEAIRIAQGLVALEIDGGAIEGPVRRPIMVVGDPAGPVTIRGLSGLAKVTTAANAHRVTMPWLGTKARWHLAINGRAADAPTLAAQVVLAAAGGSAVTQTLWSMGAAATGTASISGSADVGRPATDERVLHLDLDVRQFGLAAPTVDASGYA